MFLLVTPAEEGVGGRQGDGVVLCMWDLGSAVCSETELNPLSATTSILQCFVSSLHYFVESQLNCTCFSLKQTWQASLSGVPGLTRFDPVGWKYMCVWYFVAWVKSAQWFMCVCK